MMYVKLRLVPTRMYVHWQAILVAYVAWVPCKENDMLQYCCNINRVHAVAAHLAQNKRHDSDNSPLNQRLGQSDRFVFVRLIHRMRLQGALLRHATRWWLLTSVTVWHGSSRS